MFRDPLEAAFAGSGFASKVSSVNDLLKTAVTLPHSPLKHFFPAVTRVAVPSINLLVLLLIIGASSTFAGGNSAGDILPFRFNQQRRLVEVNDSDAAHSPSQSPSIQSPPIQSPISGAASDAPRAGAPASTPDPASTSASAPAPASAPASAPVPAARPFPRCISRYPTVWNDSVVCVNTSAWANAKAVTTTGPPPPTLEPEWERFGVCSGGKGPFQVTITPRRIGTTWKGWGTSLAWLGNYIGGFPQAARDTLLDLMFRPDTGLGLNIVRFNIGGGSLPQHSPQLYSDQILRWRAMPGYWPSEGSAFNWTADANQQAVLLGAKQRGVNVFEAFSNSPPWWMTVTKDVAGSRKHHQPNLMRRHEGKFVRYLVDVVERFKKDSALGNIEFDTLEPFNEALEGYWLKGMGQEGCNFKMGGMARIILKTVRLLRKRRLKTALAGVDSFTSTSLFYFPVLLGKIFFRRINVHGYALPLQSLVNMTVSQAEKVSAAKYIAMKVLAKSLRKPIWVTESGPMNRFGSSYELSLYMMRNVIESVNILEASAYVYWQVFDPVETWSLFGLNWWYPPGYTGTVDPPTKLKRFWMFKQLTDLVWPGSRPLLVPLRCRHTVSAFYNKQRRTVSAFIVNQQEKDKEVNVRLSRFKLNMGGRTEVLVRRTTYTEDYIQSAVAVHGTPRVRVLAEGQSFVSVTFTNVQRTRWFV